MTSQRELPCVHLGKRAVRYRLDDIEGIGPVRRRALLRHFGSLRRIREAAVDEIAAVKGMNRELAAGVRRHLEAMASLLDGEERRAAEEAAAAGPQSPEAIAAGLPPSTEPAGP